MRTVSLMASAGGVVVAFYGVLRLWRMNPDDPKYVIAEGATRVRGRARGGLRNYARDQQRWTGVILLGTVFQLASLLAALASR
jgi:hypothetical protein